MFIIVALILLFGTTVFNHVRFLRSSHVKIQWCVLSEDRTTTRYKSSGMLPYRPRRANRRCAPPSGTNSLRQIPTSSDQIPAPQKTYDPFGRPTPQSMYQLSYFSRSVFWGGDSFRDPGGKIIPLLTSAISSAVVGNFIFGGSADPMKFCVCVQLKKEERVFKIS